MKRNDITGAHVAGLNFGFISIATKALLGRVKRWQRHIALALLTGEYVIRNGVITIGDQFQLAGRYFGDIRNPSPLRTMPFDPLLSPNLLVDQGILKTLAVMWGADAKIATHYCTLFQNAVTPTGSLTAANVASTLGEITSTVEGFSNATRPAFVPAAPAAYKITNAASKAAFNIVATTSINVEGAFLISDSARGGTTGVLSSASRFPSLREFFNGETFDLGYEVSLTD